MTLHKQFCKLRQIPVLSGILACMRQFAVGSAAVSGSSGLQVDGSRRFGLGAGYAELMPAEGIDIACTVDQGQKASRFCLMLFRNVTVVLHHCPRIHASRVRLLLKRFAHVSCLTGLSFCLSPPHGRNTLPNPGPTRPSRRSFARCRWTSTRRTHCLPYDKGHGPQLSSKALREKHDHRKNFPKGSCSPRLGIVVQRPYMRWVLGT